MNRAPSANDNWWADHVNKCGGSYTKIKEPDNFQAKKKGRKKESTQGGGDQRKREKGESTGRKIDSFFSPVKRDDE